MVKATFKGNREPMELEGDMILGTTIPYDAIRNSEVFIIGDVKHSILPGALADFHMAFHAVAEEAREEDSDEEETGKEN